MVAQTHAQNADLTLLQVRHAQPVDYRIYTLDELAADDPDILAERLLREANAKANTDARVTGEGADNTILVGKSAKTDATRNERAMRYRQRNAALRTVIEGLLVAWGWGWASAQEMAGWWISGGKKAREYAVGIAQKYGYCYESCQWVLKV